MLDTRNQVSCVIWDVCNENMGDSREEISDKEYRVSAASKEEALSFPVEEETIYCWAHERLHKTSYRF